MTTGVPSGVVARPSSPVGRTVEEAFDVHAQDLKAFALAAVRDAAAADDLVEETFVRFVREVRAGRIPDNVGVWLYRVCAELVISRGRREPAGIRKGPSVLDVSVLASPEDIRSGHDDQERLRAALAELPADARIALLLAAAGLPSAEIAGAIGRSADATSTYICRARVRLQELLSPRPKARR